MWRGSLSANRTILLDSREQKPLPFPDHLPYSSRPGHVETVRLHILRRPLPEADFHLLPADGPFYRSATPFRGCIVERKHSLDELAENLLTSRAARFEEILRAMCRWPHRLLLLEGSPSSLFTTRNSPYRAEEVRDSLQPLALKHRVSIHFIPTPSRSHRLQVAEWAAAFLLNAEEVE